MACVRWHATGGSTIDLTRRPHIYFHCIYRLHRGIDSMPSPRLCMAGQCALDTFSARNIPGMHMTPTSSPWSQLCTPHGLNEQSSKTSAVLLHLTLSSHMGPIQGKEICEQLALFLKNPLHKPLLLHNNIHES